MLKTPSAAQPAETPTGTVEPAKIDDYKDLAESRKETIELQKFKINTLEKEIGSLKQENSYLKEEITSLKNIKNLWFTIRWLRKN